MRSKPGAGAVSYTEEPTHRAPRSNHQKYTDLVKDLNSIFSQLRPEINWSWIAVPDSHYDLRLLCLENLSIQAVSTYHHGAWVYLHGATVVEIKRGSLHPQYNSDQLDLLKEALDEAICGGTEED